MMSFVRLYFPLILTTFVACQHTINTGGGGGLIFGDNGRISGPGGHQNNGDFGIITVGNGRSPGPVTVEPECSKVNGSAKTICTCPDGYLFKKDGGQSKCIRGESGKITDLFCFEINGRCFKVLVEKQYWKSASKACIAHGMMLAEPKDDEAVSLRLYLTETKKEVIDDPTWLGASSPSTGNACKQMWTRKRKETESSLWYREERPVCGFCLTMLTRQNSRTKPNSSRKPYEHYGCDDHKYPALCELVQEDASP